MSKNRVLDSAGERQNIASMSLDEQHSCLMTYLLAKFLQRDWHGVSDAANDLRVLEAQIQLREL
jgi:hypothetical protein